MNARPPLTTAPDAEPQPRSGECGQTLIELLIAAAMTVIVLGAIGSLLVLSQRQQQKNVNYDLAQSSAQEALNRMVGQIRDATNIIAWGPNYVDMDVNVGGVLTQVYYECDVSAGNGWNSCVRLELAANAPEPTSLTGATTVVPYISNGTIANPVFSWSNSGQSITTAQALTTTITTATTATLTTTSTDTTTTAQNKNKTTTSTTTVTTTTTVPTTTTSTSVSTTTTSSNVTPVTPDYVKATVDAPASDGVTASSLSLTRTIAFSAGALIRNVDLPN